MLSLVLPLRWELLLGLVAVVVGIKLWYTRHRLRHIPGPFVASFSNFWKLQAVWHYDMPRRNIAVHALYGPLVRIGPNHISVADPDAVRTIYDYKNILTKSAFYPTAEALYNGKPLQNLFTTRSNEYHAQLKRASAAAFTMTALKEMEPHVGRCVQQFIDRLREVSAGGNKAVDMSAWSHWFTFDVLGEVHFSRNIGFMRTGTDVDNNIALIDAVAHYGSMIGQVPYLHKLFLGNPILPKLFPSFEKANQVQNFAIKEIEDRLKQPSSERDLLARLLEVHQADSKRLSYREVIGVTTTNILAGSDTAATVLRTALYHMCLNPHIQHDLLKEVLSAEAAGQASKPITYNEAAKLPYLSAIVNEAMRIHPPTGFVLERDVPLGGMVLCGQHIPAGTVVGVNPWVLHRDQHVFGHDVESFRPERWLEGGDEGNSSAKIAERQRNLGAFGIGPRTCIGRNIALMELWKVLPELVRAFKFQLVDQSKPWRVEGLWFTKQLDMDMFMLPRDPAAL